MAMVPSSRSLPAECLVTGIFEKRRHSRLGKSKLSTLGAVRAGVRLGAVTSKWERRWFCLTASGELQWHSADGDQTLVQVADSCIIFNALITSSKDLLETEVGAEINEVSGQYYLLIATATRRLTLRTDSSAERDRWAEHLAAIARPGGQPAKVLDLPKPPSNVSAEPELVFASAPMRWDSERNGGQMVISADNFRDMCARHPTLASPRTVSDIYHGLVTNDQPFDAMLTFDRFECYVNYLAKSQTEAPAFGALKTSLGLPAGVLLIRTEELVQSTTKNLPVNNGTLFLTDTHLIHQAWDSDLPLNIISLACIKEVKEVAASGILSIADTLVLIGVDVLQVRRHEISGKYHMEDAVPYHGVDYRLQFSVIKDMLLASGGGGGRRGLWLDILSEMILAHKISTSFDPSLHAASKLPRFAAGTLVQARAIFRTSGFYSRALLLCTNHPDAGRQWVESVSTSLFPVIPAEGGTVEELSPEIAPGASVSADPVNVMPIEALEESHSSALSLVGHQASPSEQTALAKTAVVDDVTQPKIAAQSLNEKASRTLDKRMSAKVDNTKAIIYAPGFNDLRRTAASLMVLFVILILSAFTSTPHSVVQSNHGPPDEFASRLQILRVSPSALFSGILAIVVLRRW
jgi:hypothetical protein